MDIGTINYHEPKLQGMTTRALKSLKDQTYRIDCDAWIYNPEEFDRTNAFRKKILAILKTREHVPNKKEAKAIRQAAAKKKR